MRIMSCYFRRFIIAAFSAALIYYNVQVLRPKLKFNDTDPSQSEKLMHISQMINDAKQQTLYTGDGVPACKFPDLDILNPEIIKFIKEVKPLNCNPEDWVDVEGSKLQITKRSKELNGQITCAFSEIVRVDDFKVRLTTAVESDDSYILKESDFAEVRCESRTGKQWHSVLAGVKRDPAVKTDFTWDKVPKKALKLNVLMFGFDSLSRNTFIRKLPKSYRYLKQNLNSLVLEGYNIVGDGTPQALIPILTGKIELELPETRKRMGMKANYVDIYPLIWQKYKASGYITGFMEDVHHIGTFTYRLKGFKKQPTDHYMRTFYLAAEPLFKYSKKFCLNGVPRHSVMMNYIKTIFDEYRDQPKFVFGFHGELSHDSYNDIGTADEDVYQWIKSLNSNGHLNNTILIIMSDHGHRFAAIRNTVQGKQEERLPFFSFTFPPWFKQVYPRAYTNFVYNTEHLTTPFDIHRTIEKLLDFGTPKEGDKRERAINLFDKMSDDIDGGIQKKLSDAQSRKRKLEKQLNLKKNTSSITKFFKPPSSASKDVVTEENQDVSAEPSSQTTPTTVGVEPDPTECEDVSLEKLIEEDISMKELIEEDVSMEELIGEETVNDLALWPQVISDKIIK